MLLHLQIIQSHISLSLSPPPSLSLSLSHSLSLSLIIAFYSCLGKLKSDVTHAVGSSLFFALWHEQPWARFVKLVQFLEEETGRSHSRTRSAFLITWGHLSKPLTFCWDCTSISAATHLFLSFHNRCALLYFTTVTSFFFDLHLIQSTETNEKIPGVGFLFVCLFAHCLFVCRKGVSVLH